MVAVKPLLFSAYLKNIKTFYVFLTFYIIFIIFQHCDIEGVEKNYCGIYTA